MPDQKKIFLAKQFYSGVDQGNQHCSLQEVWECTSFEIYKGWWFSRKFINRHAETWNKMSYRMMIQDVQEDIWKENIYMVQYASFGYFCSSLQNFQNFDLALIYYVIHHRSSYISINSCNTLDIYIMRCFLQVFST